MGNKIITGLKDALRHARCVNRHVESHVTTKTAEREYTTECIACGHSWTERVKYDGLEAIRVVTPKD